MLALPSSDVHLPATDPTTPHWSGVKEDADNDSLEV
jgi:hypothetical protein